MRNWNFTLFVKPISATTTLPDYLWGIETPDGGGASLVHWSFQTTYEELKPPFIGNDEQTHEGFQTTYEELKPLFTASRMSSGRSFQTTYEELKLTTCG